MATGGAARASVKGSDEFYPFWCSPCSRKEIDVGAEVYCIQCEEYLCGKCHSNHDSFAKMAAHTMLDRAQMEAKGPQRPTPLLTVQPLLTVPCDLHPGERYNLFCEKHNRVCCAVCSRIYHKSCDVRYILDVKKESMQGPELKEFRREVKQIQTHLEMVKKQRESDMERMAAEKKTEINKIHTSIQQMIKQLEAIEKTATNDVTRKFNEFKTNIENDITKLGSIINTLNIKLDKLEKANDDTEKFVHMKICEQDKSSARNLIADIEARVGGEKLQFLIDERVEESIRNLQSLGQLVYLYTVTPEGQHRVTSGKDKRPCDIADIALMKDGSLLMTDWDNQCLRRFDQKYTVIDQLQLINSPQGVCSVSANKVAVCLRDSVIVQLVSLHPTLSVSMSFKTTSNCRCIVHHADHLYVTCGGRREFGEGSGHMAVYTISGILVRKLETDIQGKLFSSIPIGVAVRSTDGVILVCDHTNGLIALRPDGQRLWTRTCKELKVNTVKAVIVDSHGHMLLSCKRSNKVVLVRGDGRKHDVVLTADDGLNKPYAMCFDQARLRLIVATKHNGQINMFKLT